MVECGVPQPLNELDDLDPKEYAFRVVNPRWSGGFEDRVRCALERAGFVIERLVINPDDSMATFWLRPSQPLAHFQSVAAARLVLEAALTNVGCPCGELELARCLRSGSAGGQYQPDALRGRPAASPMTGSAIRVHKTSPFCDLRFIEDLCVLQWCSVYSSFMNTAATAVYLRVSTESQRTDMQLRDLKAYCQQRKWKYVVYYSDKISGGKDSRPELDRMMKDIRAGKIERVLCWKLDRFGRSLSHLAFLIAELDRNNVALIVPGQGIDTGNDSYIGKMQRGILMVIAEFEKDIIRDRVLSGLAAAKARGVSAWSSGHDQPTHR